MNRSKTDFLLYSTATVLW